MRKDKSQMANTKCHVPYTMCSFDGVKTAKVHLKPQSKGIALRMGHRCL